MLPMILELVRAVLTREGGAFPLYEVYIMTMRNPHLDSCTYNRNI